MRVCLARLGLLAVVAGLLPAAAGAQTLRYGGDEGDLDRYRLTNTVKIHQEFQGTATDLTLRSFSLLSLKLERAEQDTLIYAVAFDSLDIKLEGAPVPAPNLSCLLGQKMSLKLSPTGRVQGFDVPADMCEMPSGFDVKQLVSHFFPRLPEGNADPGATWSDTLDYSVSQQGIDSQVHVVTHYTSRGTTREAGQERVEVDYTTATSIQGKGEQAGTPLFVNGTGKGSGTVSFEPDGEKFLGSTGSQTLDLVVEVTPEGQPPRSIPIRQEVTARIEHL